jgi:riboflavin synthase
VFTGLVECVGTVVSISPPSGGVASIGLDAPQIASCVAVGESVAVSGACLTATASGGRIFYAQMMAETLRSTRLGSLKTGERVNLERALKLGGRLDGHMVLGHVDAVGAVARVDPDGDSKKIWITAPDNISWGVAPKGSVAIDGVSLTVIDSGDDMFSVGLIPATLSGTTLGFLAPGGRVNIEIDVMARYVARMFRRDDAAAAGGITWEKLSEYGWR